MPAFLAALPAIGTGLFQGITGLGQRKQAREMLRQSQALETGLTQQYQNLATQGMSGAEYGKAQQNISNLVGMGLYNASNLGRGMAQGLIGRMVGQAQGQQLNLDVANEQRRYKNIMNFLAFQNQLRNQKLTMGQQMEQMGASNVMKGFGNVAVAGTQLLQDAFKKKDQASENGMQTVSPTTSAMNYPDMTGIKINPVNALMRIPKAQYTTYPQEQGMPLGIYGAGMEETGIIE